jgi:hypothetical protein
MLALIVSSALFVCTVLMLVFPRTPAARTLHRILVEAPARFLCDLTWAKAGQIALSVAALVLMMAMGPQMLALAVAMGADAAFFEVLIVLWLTSASGQMAAAARFVKRMPFAVRGLVKRLAVRAGNGRKPRPRRKSRPQGRKDDSDGQEWAFA